jgi:putative transposase
MSLLLLLCTVFLMLTTNAASLWLSSWLQLNVHHWRRLVAPPKHARSIKRKSIRASTKQRRSSSRAKPQWVTDELIRMCAFYPPRTGARTIATNFNRRFAPFMSVGKTFVSDRLKEHRYAIAMKKREIRNAVPIPCEPNEVWGLDLTGKNDVYGHTHHILGIVDHGTRVSVALKAIPIIDSLTLLAHLFIAISAHGKPKAIRTDNGPQFTSRVFKTVLALIGIQHQRTQIGCPWMNGRIERFFGTLKSKLNQMAFHDAEQLNHALSEFNLWYNEVRPHSNLDGRTPMEALNGIDYRTRRPRSIELFEAWEGVLKGFRMRW